jgi:hypothetical protein
MSRGRPKHVPTDESRQTVYDLTSFGVTEPEVCKYLKIDPKTLRKYYHEILESAQLHSNREVARVLYKKAVVDEEISACIFWLKTRARWSTADSKRIAEATESILEKLPTILAKNNAE